ncbi:unnamed protein product [Dovyalis caffra]|uniref:FAD/NAD(P)-binding domain-containing protein n=1 Tax=Dovyalis caffra TaxID=77055 RepID=A0AAV1REJ1_9ROSI|nr:unnamed protein product [Dovyalis caffra]
MRKEYFEVTWASLRCMVEPSFGERSVINHKDYFTNGNIVTSTAIGITETEVLTADGHSIPYDYLVIATGHKDPVSETKAGRLKEFQAAENEKIKSAQSILIVGGGPSGVKLAGEIAVDFPEKQVTLVHNGPRLLEFIGPKAADKTLKWFARKKVEVKLEQSVDLNSVTNSNGCKIYHTTAGETIQADCHFLCTGKPLASAWLKDTMLKNKLDDQGRLMVDEHLRVKGLNNIFAIGDITDIADINQGVAAQNHPLLAANNLKLLMGGKEGKMSSYKPGAAMAIVSLGRRDAVVQLPFGSMIGRFPGLIKSKDLFVGKARKDRGV